MIKSYKDGSLLEVYVQPKASRTQIVGPFGEALKIKLKAPPVEGRANEELRAFLAKILGLPQKRIKLLSGLTSRRKSIYISGVTPQEIRQRIKF